MRTYSRLDRAGANATIIGILFVGVRLFKDAAPTVAFAAALAIALAIVLYAYYIASQQCARCHESFAANRPKPYFYFALVVLHVPGRCPHCGERASW